MDLESSIHYLYFMHVNKSNENHGVENIMKFTIGNAAPRKSFNFAAATEALSDSYLRLGDAYEQVVAAEGRIAELEMTMDNCRCAVQAIEKFGVTATTMAVFNGSNELDAALSLEALDIASIESLGASVKKIRKENYVSGLEGKISEYWNKFVAWLKDLWGKIVRWFKELFDKNAKAVRIVTEAKNAGAFKNLANSDKKGKILSPDQVGTLLTAADDVMAYVASEGEADATKLSGLTNAGIIVGEGGKLTKDKDFAAKFEKKETEFKTWAGKADSLVEQFSKCATGSAAKKMVADMDKNFKAGIDAAKKAASAEGAGEEEKKKAEELAKTRREKLSKCNAAISIYNTLVSMAGNTLVALANAGAKATKKEETPAS